MRLPLQLHPVPEGILFQVDWNYFILPPEIKSEARVLSIGTHNCRNRGCARFSSIRECSGMLNKLLTGNFFMRMNSGAAT